MSEICKLDVRWAILKTLVLKYAVLVFGTNVTEW